jgi:hypothetical protein
MIPKLNRIFFIIFVSTILFSGCIKSNQDSQDKTQNISQNISESISKNETVSISKELCEQHSGTWNECGSACQGTPPGTMCIQSCVKVCECEELSQCPPGFECRMNQPTKGKIPTPGVCITSEG